MIFFNRYQAEADLRLNGQRTPSSPGSQASQVYMEHSYSLPPALPERAEPAIRAPATSAKVKHTKIVKLTKTKDKENEKEKEEEEKIHKEAKSEKRKSNKYTKLHSSCHQSREGEKENIQNDYMYEKSKQVSQSLVTYKERDLMSEMAVLYEFLTRGIDFEDVEYLRRSYEALLADDSQGYWLNDTHWVDHPPTDIPSPAKRRKRDELRLHASGSARTEGYYKVDVREKAKHKVVEHRHLRDFNCQRSCNIRSMSLFFSYCRIGVSMRESLTSNRFTVVVQHHYAQSIQRSNDVEDSGGSYTGGDGTMNGPKSNSKALTGKMQALSREARSNQRRLLTAFGIDTDSDLLKFNQLKVRRASVEILRPRLLWRCVRSNLGVALVYSSSARNS